MRFLAALLFALAGFAWVLSTYWVGAWAGQRSGETALYAWGGAALAAMLVVACLVGW